jgi:hypothetical protein
MTPPSHHRTVGMDSSSEDSDEEDGRGAFWVTSVSDLVSGRQTIFCCLACGIPFSFPDDSYIYRNNYVQKFVQFTHYVRRQMRMHDRSKASTTQWQLNLSHYIHKYLHGSIDKSSEFGDSGGDDNISKCWNDQKSFVEASTRLIASLQMMPQQTSTRSFRKPPLSMDEEFLNLKSPWCQACNTAATHAVKIKQILGLKGRKASVLPGVPSVKQLPMGMRIMHDTYLFIYLMASFLSILLSRSMSPDISPTEVGFVPAHCWHCSAA